MVVFFYLIHAQFVLWSHSFEKLQQLESETCFIWPRFYIMDEVGVSIIIISSPWHTENALKMSKNHEMWLRFYMYIEDKVGVTFIISNSLVCIINFVLTNIANH